MELEIWIIHRKIIWKHLFYAQILRWQINFRSCFSGCSLWSWPPSSPYYSSPSLSLVSSSSSSWFSSLSTGIPSSPSLSHRNSSLSSVLDINWSYYCQGWTQWWCLLYHWWPEIWCRDQQPTPHLLSSHIAASSGSTTIQWYNNIILSLSRKLWDGNTY